MLGTDGVMRSFSGPFTRDVIDAVALSPDQIKLYLERSSMAKEVGDKFHGVDGRNVVDYEALYHPPEELRPPNMTEEEVRKQTVEIEEHNRKLYEKYEREKRERQDQEMAGA